MQVLVFHSDQEFVYAKTVQYVSIEEMNVDMRQTA